MPDLTGTLVADHAGADRCPGCANLPEEPAVGGLRDSPEHFVADACRMFGSVSEYYIELLLGVVPLELFLQR